MNTFKKHLYQLLAITTIITLASCSKNEDVEDDIEKNTEITTSDKNRNPNIDDIEIDWQISYNYSQASMDIKNYTVYTYVSRIRSSQTKLSDIKRGFFTVDGNYSYEPPLYESGDAYTDYGIGKCWCKNYIKVDRIRQTQTEVVFTIELNNGETRSWTKTLRY